MAYFTTSEGYYDYANNRYIYQYKDHLGNVRTSYARNPDTGSAEVLDRNDYYPFGMNMQGYSSAFDSAGGVYNNKYNQKELQETGFYDYGWRQYMPDIGRWNGMDQLSETYSSTSPYAYVMNNPVMMFDPDGRVTTEWLNGFYNASGSGSTTWTNTGDGFTSGSSYSNGMTGHFSYGGEFTMSNMIQEVVIQGRGNASNWNSSVNHAFNSLSLMSGIMGAQANWNGEQARSRLHAAMGDSVIDDVQTMLDGVGTVPFFGEVADGMNGLISLGRGRKAQAALSFGAMVPFLGWGAVAMKYAKPEVKMLYRSVSPAELADIAENGLRMGETGYATEKLFTTTAKDASFFSKSFYPWDKTANTIIQIEVPTGVMKNTGSFIMDGKNVVSIPAGQLQFINNIKSLNYSPIP